MYSKDSQTATSNNPAFYRQRRTNNYDGTHRHQEAQACTTPPYISNTSYFAKSQETKETLRTHASTQATSLNTSRNDRKQDHIVQVNFDLPPPSSSWQACPLMLQ